MAERLNVSPTHGNLLNLRETLAGIRMRHGLLDRKREVLVREFMERSGRARELESRSQDLFLAAHEALQTARMRMGSDRIDWIALAPAARIRVDTAVRTIMGLRIPVIDMDIEAITPPYGISDTSAALDEAREKWMEVLEFLAQSSETLTSVWRIAMELKKTQRQVNALENTLIPRYQRTIAFIESRLEEEEREEIVHVKKVKEMKG